MAHSLDEAVEAGTISEYTAFCGLSPEDVLVVADKHPEARLLLRIRSRYADGRLITTALEFAQWIKQQEQGPTCFRVGDSMPDAWRYEDIRDVTAIAL